MQLLYVTYIYIYFCLVHVPSANMEVGLMTYAAASHQEAIKRERSCRRSKCLISKSEHPFPSSLSLRGGTPSVVNSQVTQRAADHHEAISSIRLSHSFLPLTSWIHLFSAAHLSLPSRYPPPPPPLLQHLVFIMSSVDSSPPIALCRMTSCIYQSVLYYSNMLNSSILRHVVTLSLSLCLFVSLSLCLSVSLSLSDLQ